MAGIKFPFLTSYDPAGTSEGTLDPLGLYQIADQLAVQLVPAIRERMQRIRFLTAMAVGALVTEELDDEAYHRAVPPYLAWEWLVVEALVRSGDDPGIWGVPGTLVTRRALDQHGYIDARSYLKTPRIFGFHGVYKRLAIHLGIMDVNLAQGPNAEELVDAWARGMKECRNLSGARSLISRWSRDVRHSMDEKPPRTKPSFNQDEWAMLAHAFAPSGCKTREMRCLHRLLHSADDRRLGALPAIWELQEGFSDEAFREETLHDRLEEKHPEYGQLLAAIRAYEAFARSLQDAFDVMKAEAAKTDTLGYAITDIARDKDFKKCVQGLHLRYAAAQRALGESAIGGYALQNQFSGRFGSFADHLDPADCARAFCAHHETVQRAKSADGKRPWFDNIGKDRIYIRYAYRVPRRPVMTGRYVHEYRGQPIRRFYKDLS